MRTAITFLCAGVLLSGCYLSHTRSERAARDASVPSDSGPEPPQGFVQIAAGYGAACARLGDARVACWGGGAQCGSLPAERPESAIPARARLVPGIEDAIDIAGTGRFFCAIRSTGETVCWGRWLPSECWAEPARVPELDGAERLSAS